MPHIFSSESVSEGHPDKVCDAVSDAILDLCLTTNPKAHLACEVMATTNRLIIAGEGDSLPPASQIEQAARQTIKKIGYEQQGFHWQSLKVENYLHAQSANISKGVGDEGAGDQGIMFGYASDETPTLMPAALYYCNAILLKLREGRQNGKLELLEPDAKSQLSIIYEEGKPVGCASVTVSSQHKKEATKAELEQAIMEAVEQSLPKGWLTKDTAIHINPAGDFIIGGPDGDCGLTGRKIVVDTYGGAAPHGGGAFSGKDATKVDRSAAYIARWVAKNIVAAGLASKCTLQLCYAIGTSQPLAKYFDFHNTEKIPARLIEEKITELVDFSPKGIRSKLGLEKPIYSPTSAYGHFGRAPKGDFFSWESDALTAELSKLL